MKVAVFGCLHGMLNEMYQEVDQYEQQTGTTIDFVLVCGDCQTMRHADDLVCLSVPNKYKTVGDFPQYYEGRKKIPKLTIFVGGNHEASSYLMTLPYGGWVCENFYYLGYAGVIRYKGIRIAGISGIYNFHNCQKGRYEQLPLDRQTIRSVYHTRKLDAFRLQLLSRNAEQDQIQVFLSHDWPTRIYDHGNVNEILRLKPGFQEDMNSRDGLGSPLTEPLVYQLKPKRWFAAHLHIKWGATVTHDEEAGKCTEFLSLNKYDIYKKSGQFWKEILDIPTSSSSDDELYYDAEWLTVLRKTCHLEKTTEGKVECPDIRDNYGKSFFPSREEVQQTVDIMTKGDPDAGLRIPRNFQMSEPVIYNRQSGEKSSADPYRKQYFPNPQHEELCSRLQLSQSSTPFSKQKQQDNPNSFEEEGCLPFYIDKSRC